MQKETLAWKPLIAPAAYKLQIEIINTFTRGNILKNKIMANFLPENSSTNQLIIAARKGTPVVTFGKKDIPGILILAGMHGNELPPQIAAVRLINKLITAELNITVHIIPFAIPLSTEYGIRSWKGQDPNRTAEIFGTPTNNVLTFSQKNNVKYLGDFHSTRPGGFPGKLSVICSEAPCFLSFQMANFIEKETKSTMISFTKAGSMYPGALQDVFNLKGIPAVTGEVMSPHGTVMPGSIDASLEQMEAFMRYHKAYRATPPIT